MSELSIGAYSVPFILTIALQILYKVAGTTINDRWKSVFALLAGVGLGMIGMFYNEAFIGFKSIIDYGLGGLIDGCAAVGLYEVQRSALRPRT